MDKNDPKQDVIKETDKDDSDVLTPSGDMQTDCSAVEIGCDASKQPCQDVNVLNEKLRPIEQQLKYLLNKAEEVQAHLMHSRCDHVQNEGFSCAVPTFLRTCQPYFSYLESTARSSLPERTPLPICIRSQLLDFSQQLCTRLEQLVLTSASYNFLSLVESEPDSISHFYIGYCQIDRVKLSIFRYCRPTPYLAGTHTGLYKRMRWNVVKPSKGKEGERGEAEGERDIGKTDGDSERETASVKESAVTTEYYFLCYEDIPKEHTVGRSEGEEEPVATGDVVRMWSIGYWIPTHPDPDDIYDWILCSVPQGQYGKLLCLGGEEPSACSATDCLLGVLLSQESVSMERASL
ncbi:UPF0575 protein C19orf67 homolog [Osmerus mordax]|uniref:UPF0575 protein C19orf67 homolog n=1 Tax=Osmerus mordax TaxID=8014 RepID=UPI00350EED43